MKSPPIKTESDYQNALTEIERLFDVEPLSPELDRLDILTAFRGHRQAPPFQGGEPVTTLVEAYEQQHYPIDAPDPI